LGLGIGDWGIANRGIPRSLPANSTEFLAQIPNPKSSSADKPEAFGGDDRRFAA